jgi:DNA-binding FadR family transcriptional regulator
VVREAVSQLESLGLLTVRRGRGTFVGDPSSVIGGAQLLRNALAIADRDLLHFTEFRKAIESHAARRAAESATDEQLAELARLCVAIDSPDQDEAACMKADFAFHSYLMSITANPLMENLLSVVQEFVFAAMVRTTSNPRDREGSQRVHGAIVKAIRSRDPDAAEKSMRAHMELTATMLTALEKKGKKK